VHHIKTCNIIQNPNEAQKMSNINNTPPSPPAVELLWPPAGTENGTYGSSASA